MDDLQTSDEVTFLVENVEPVVYDVIEAILKDKVYNDTLVQGWVDEICSRITKDLIDTNKPFKYAGKMTTQSIICKEGCYDLLLLIIFNPIHSNQ